MLIISKCMKLARCSSLLTSNRLIPLLPQSLVDDLDSIGIRTDADLLVSSSALDIFYRLPNSVGDAGRSPLVDDTSNQNCITLLQLKEYIELVSHYVSPPGQRADMILASLDAKTERPMRCGVPAMDDGLLASLGDGCVLEISGARYAGKTTLALRIALCHLASDPSPRVSWIDTTGDFSVQRAGSVLELYREEIGYPTALERLQVSLAFDIDSANVILDSIASQAEVPLTHYLIIDTITHLLGPSLSYVSAQGHAAMVTLMRQLRFMARSHGLHILLINNSTSTLTPTNAPATVAIDGDRPQNPYSRKPALGPSFTYLTDTTLWLSSVTQEEIVSDEAEKENRNSMIKVQVLRSRKTVRCDCLTII